MIIFLIIWYLSGTLALLGAEYQDEGEINLKALVLSLTVGGFMGFLMVFLAGVKIILEASETQEWEDFWNQKIF